jgi:hypothetical protein
VTVLELATELRLGSESGSVVETELRLGSESGSVVEQSQ